MTRGALRFNEAEWKAYCARSQFKAPAAPEPPAQSPPPSAPGGGGAPQTASAEDVALLKEIFGDKVTTSGVGESRPKSETDVGPVARRSSSGPVNAEAGVATGPLTPSKYRNKPTNGYASIKESKRAFQLKLMQEAGQIRNLREQVPYLLIPKQDGERACHFVADFTYEEWGADVDDSGPVFVSWRPVVEDCKGYRTEVYRIKRKLMKMVHNVSIRET